MLGVMILAIRGIVTFSNELR